MQAIKIIGDIADVELIKTRSNKFTIANLLVCTRTSSGNHNETDIFNIQLLMDENTTELLTEVENKFIAGQRIIVDNLYLATQIEPQKDEFVTLRLNTGEKVMNNIQFVSEINKPHFPCSIVAHMVAFTNKQSESQDDSITLSVVNSIFFGLNAKTHEPVEVFNTYTVKMAIDGTSVQFKDHPLEVRRKVVLRNMSIYQERPIEIRGKYYHRVNFALTDPIDNLGFE